MAGGRSSVLKIVVNVALFAGVIDNDMMNYGNLPRFGREGA